MKTQTSDLERKNNTIGQPDAASRRQVTLWCCFDVVRVFITDSIKNKGIPAAGTHIPDFFIGTLNQYMTDARTGLQSELQGDFYASKQLDALILQMARAEGVTEHLKSENQIERVQRMNCIRNRAEEIVYFELITHYH